MTTIMLQSLRKEYHGQVAIPDLDLEVHDGEFFTLLGPSGCGKTTLLRMIAGFSSVEHGSIAFDGAVVNDRPASARNIGMVFQNYALFPQMTSAKNVAFGLQMRKTTKGEASARVQDALESVQMAHLSDRLPGAMSGGQQQRIALARALVIRPDVLLMDEPLSNLDAKLRVEMRDMIREVQRDAGITTVYVTHDQEEAMAVSSRIAVLNFGEVQQVGAPAEIYHRPANTFVAGFIGKTNLLPGFIRESGSIVEIGGIAVAVKGLKDIGDESDVTVSIRPEAVRISDTGIAATVDDAVFLGSHWQVRARLSGGEVIELLDHSAFAAPTPGTAIRLAVDADRLNVFDRDGISIMADTAA